MCNWYLLLRKRETFLGLVFISEQLICPGKQPGVLNLRAESPKGRFKIYHIFKIFSSTWQFVKKKVLSSL